MFKTTLRPVYATKEFVRRHKTAITATALVTAKVVTLLRDDCLQEAYDFIDAAGLTEKFEDSLPPYSESFN